MTGAQQDQARLAAFERMLAALQANYAETTARLQEAKAAGKEKTAAFRQLLGNKMLYKNMLDLYGIYGLLDQEGGKGKP